MQNRVLYSPALLPLLLLCPLAALISCGGSSASSSTPAPANVYVAGISGGAPQYWSNGASTPLGSTGTAAAIAISGSDIYVAGYSAPTSEMSVATYWENGSAVTLSGTAPSLANGITVSQGNVYISGDVNSDSSYLATVWMNGAATQLMDGFLDGSNLPNLTDANSLYVSGADVYVAGLVDKCILIATNTYYCGDVAVYWKNGNPTELVQLTNGGTESLATSIFVSGADVYVTGNEFGISPSVPMLWKNGQAITLPASLTAAQSVFVNGPDVYVAGACGENACYVLNGAVQVLPNVSSSSSGVSQANQVIVSGSDVYVAGETEGTPAYWADGTLYSLSTSTGNANGIVVIPD